MQGSKLRMARIMSMDVNCDGSDRSSMIGVRITASSYGPGCPNPSRGQALMVDDVQIWKFTPLSIARWCVSQPRASLHGASAAAVLSTVWLSAGAVRIDGSDRAPISAWRRWSSVRIAVGAEGLLFVHAVLLLALANAVVVPCS